MSDCIKTDKVLDLLAGVVAEVIKMPPEEPEKSVLEKPARDLIDKRTVNLILGRTETHDKRTETHGVCLDVISRQAAIDAINHICPADTEYDCTLLDRVDVRCVLSDLPSAEPMESHHRYEQGIIEGRVQMRTEMLKAIKDIVGNEVWNGI